MAKSSIGIKTFWSRTVEGSWLNGAYFAKHWLQIFVAMAMVLVYVANSYSCRRAQEEIRRLNNRLNIVQTESYRMRGVYMGRIRESALKEKVQQAGLDISVPTQSPYIITEK